jgi:YVTN family beta-propeller protein
MAVAKMVEGTGLSFAVLGPLEVTRSGERLPLGGHQQRAVLALLLAGSDTVVSVGRLGDALWGQETPRGFVTTIQTYVFHLREVLEPDRRHGAPGRVLVTEPGGYRLDTSGSILDSAMFEDSVHAGRDALARHAYDEASAELAGGLRLWRGEGFADVADLGFVAPVVARLEAMRMIAQGLRIEADLALGRHAEVLPELDRLVAEHPLQEQLHEQKMVALYRLDRQSDALAVYREVRRRLRDELGIEPTPHLKQLLQAVLAQDLTLDWQPQTAAESPPKGPRTRRDAMRSPPVTQPTGSHPVPPDPGRSRLAGQVTQRAPRMQVAAAAAAVLLAAGLLTMLITHWAHSGLPAFPANSVGSINGAGLLADSVQVGLSPDGLAFGAGSLWAANRTDGTVSRIDPDTHAVVQTIPVGALPNEVAVTGNDVWVVNFGDGTVSRINARTNRPVARIVVGNQPVAIASGPSGVWVANRGDDTIQRIDPITGRADKAVVVGDSPSGIAVDATAVWVCSDADGTVSEFDPVTLQPGRSILVPGGPRGIALTRNDVWVASQLSQSVTRINRSTDATLTIAVGDGPHSVLVAADGVWVSDEYDGTVTRIDPSSNQTREWAVGASPRDLAEADGKIWVASGAFAAAGHKGGTLRVVGGTMPGARGVIDPAAVSDPMTMPAERFVYDGLVAYAISGGSVSQTLVPDLALALPRPSNGDLTYAFTLRPGIRYSTGRDVQAADFRTGVLKALTLGGKREYFASIVGGRQCIDHPASCDLSGGLITDDATRRVTFNLVAPDPQFLHKLAYFVYPLPPGTPTTASRAPVPGTGPYMISAYVQGKQFTLARNPFFRQWSFAAQPGGYPDVIDFHGAPDGKAAAGEVLAGRADVAGLYPSAAALREDLAQRYPAQYKSQVWDATDFEYLNTHMAPFNDIRAREALNYAVDRNRLVAIEGASGSFSATCQVLPPDFPSYRWYCPYTTSAGDGQYHGPDLVKAVELVRRSGTRGMAVTVEGVADGADHQLNVYFAAVLRQLGYKVQLREVSPTREYDLLQARKHAQITFGPGWIADYPAGSNAYDAVFSCTAVIAGAGWYCNPQVERTAAEAKQAEMSDPALGDRLWAEVDRLITDDAPVVALGNPTPITLISTRVGNYQSSPIVGPLLSQMWVR